MLIAQLAEAAEESLGWNDEPADPTIGRKIAATYCGPRTRGLFDMRSAFCALSPNTER